MMEMYKTESIIRPKYSIILPVFNEESCLNEVLNRIQNVLGDRNSYEVLCVDDASSDSSWMIIESFHKRNPSFKGLQFKRNFGHQLAVYAGIKACQGQYVAVMDADGQDPPEVLPDMFKRCEEGYDVVYAVRKNRKEGFLKRIAYFTFYRFYRLIIPFKIPLDSGDFSVFSKDVADFIKSRSERNPFVRGLRSWYGGKQCGFEYDRKARISGQTKYSYLKLFFLAINASVSFSRIPLRLISSLGIWISIFGFIGGISIITKKFIYGVIDPIGWPSLAVMIMFFSGVNLFVLGVIGEYLGDIFEEVKARPPFIIGKTIGI